MKDLGFLKIPSGAAEGRFRADIEGLRGLAVLLVVLFHAQVPGVGRGYLGVDVFFVLSGFLITSRLAEEAESTGRISLPAFYARRARRLLPAAAVMFVATLAAGRLLYAPFEQLAVSRNALATAIYGGNLLFAYDQTDYLGPASATNPLLHTWSLSAEEQFYLIWPVLVMLCIGKTRGRTSRQRLLAGIMLIGFVSICGQLLLDRRDPIWAFYGSPTRAWEFAAGALVYLWGSGPPGAERARGRLGRIYSRLCASPGLPWAGLLLILGCGASLGSAIRIPGPPAFLPVLGASAILAYRGSQANWLLCNGVSRTAGRFSYSWYLWHWPVLVLAGTLRPSPDLASRLACVLCALGLAAITTVLIEDPVRFHPALPARPWRTLAGAAMVTSVLVLAALALNVAAARSADTADQLRFTQASRDIPIVHFDGCHLGDGTVSPPCAFADTNSSTTLVLFGDSHAAQWFPPIEHIALLHHWKLISWTKSGCPFAAVRIPPDPFSHTYRDCGKWRENTARRIVELHPAGVIVSSASTYLRVPGARNATAQVSPREWETGLRVALNRFSQAGLRTIVLRDPPQPGFEVLSCLARMAWRNASHECTFQPEPQTVAAARLEDRAIPDVAGASLVDLSPAICDAAVCDPMHSGQILFRDSRHLTGSFALSLAPLLEPELVQMVNRAGG